MKFGFRNIAFAFATLTSVFTTPVEASPLRLDYTVTEQGDIYHYDFVLSLDNHDNSWVAGQGWNLFSFGGIVGERADIKNFFFDTHPDSISEGAANGGQSDTESVQLAIFMVAPKYAANPFDPNNMWVPTATGQTLTWSGTAINDLAQGSLFFGAFTHNKLVTGDALSTKEIGIRHDGVAPVPVPAALPLFMSGIAGVAFARNRKKSVNRKCI